MGFFYYQSPTVVLYWDTDRHRHADSPVRQDWITHYSMLPVTADSWHRRPNGLHYSLTWAQTFVFHGVDVQLTFYPKPHTFFRFLLRPSMILLFIKTQESFSITHDIMEQKTEGVAGVMEWKYLSKEHYSMKGVTGNKVHSQTVVHLYRFSLSFSFTLELAILFSSKLHQSNKLKRHIQYVFLHVCERVRYRYISENF